MSILIQVMDLVQASNEKYELSINRLYRDLIIQIKARAVSGQTSLKYSVSGPFTLPDCIVISGKLRTRLLQDGFYVRDAYGVNGKEMEYTFYITW